MARPPKWLWFLAAAVALLRALPFVATFLLPHPESMSFLHVGYMPEDMHAYLSFIRQASQEGSFLLDNRYVTVEQSGRFILLFHWSLGKFAALTGIPPLWILELSRIPLVFLFFTTVWWFLTPFFAHRPDRRERLWATALIGASGGIHGVLRPLAKRLPEAIGEPFISDSWPLYGWNTFESLYNPLWIAGLILTLLVLRPTLEAYSSGDLHRRATGSFSLGVLARISGTVVLFFVHPYSALMVLAIASTVPFMSSLVEGKLEWRRLMAGLISPAVAAGIIASVGAWQRLDPVFATSSAEFFGRLHLPIFWYPLTFAALLALALRGAVVWSESRHPFRSPIIAWIGVVLLLHTSNWINGYHFIPYLHIPLAILAGTIMPSLWDSLRRGGVVRRVALAALLLLLFSAPVPVTIESLTDLPRRNLVPKPFVEATSVLAELPAGRVLAPPQMGLQVPAHTSHSVWAGHWFLTPDYWPRVELYGRLITDPGQQEELLRLVDGEGIDYLVVPSQAADRLGAALGDRLRQRQAIAGLEILTIRR